MEFYGILWNPIKFLDTKAGFVQGVLPWTFIPLEFYGMIYQILNPTKFSKTESGFISRVFCFGLLIPLDFYPTKFSTTEADFICRVFSKDVLIKFKIIFDLI